jgi:hypothetical protein
MSAQQVTATVAATDEMSAEVVPTMPDNLIYSAEGVERGPMSTAVGVLLNSPQALKYFLSEGTEEHGWFSLEWAPPRDDRGLPYYLKRIEPVNLMREITSLKDYRSLQVPNGAFWVTSRKARGCSLGLGHDVDIRSKRACRGDPRWRGS